MNATVTDNDILNALSPAEIAAYLRSRTWRIARQIEDRGAIWTLPAERRSDYQILQPLRRDLDDYTIRIQEALQVLAVAEKRSQLEILADIQDTKADVIRVRLRSAAFEDGSMPIEQAANTVAQAREMMLAAACATVHPRAVYRTRRPQQATEYMQRVRLGQTERGSYTLTIRSQVPPHLAQPNLFLEAESDIAESEIDALEPETEEPFERRVTLTLAKALAATGTAIVQAGATNDFQPFQDAVQNGVSANLCAALAGLVSNETTQQVEIGLRWASIRAVPRNAALRTQFHFSSDTVPILKEAARVFQERAIYEDFELYGFVRALRQEGTEENATITTWIDDYATQQVQALMRVPPEFRALILEAYEKRALIGCEGELIKDKKFYRLLNVRNLRIEDYIVD